jgi:hypothetical protein
VTITPFGAEALGTNRSHSIERGKRRVVGIQVVGIYGIPCEDLSAILDGQAFPFVLNSKESRYGKGHLRSL